MKKLLEKISNVIKDINPSTLTGISIATAWLAAGLMIPATIRAMKKKEKEQPSGVLQTLKCVGPCYIPPVASLVVSTATGIASNSNSLAKSASFAALATAAEHGLSDYKGIVESTVDKETLQKIDAKEAERIVRANPPHLEQTLPKAANNEILEFGAPKCICFESYTRKYFWYAPADLETLEARITNELVSDGVYKMTDLMYEFRLDPINDNNLGFQDRDYYGGDGTHFEFRTSTTTAPDGRPVLVIDYWVRPHALDPDSY